MTDVTARDAGRCSHRRMLFHITHTHTAESCPYHQPQTVRGTYGAVLASMEDAGLNVVGAWVDAAAHTFFFVVESDSADAIQAGLAPIIDQGVAVTRPVTDAGRHGGEARGGLTPALPIS